MPVNSENLKNSVERSNLNRPKQPGGESLTSKSAPSQLFQSQMQAQQAADQTKVALVSANQQRLVGLTTALDKAEQRRGEVLDRLSDRIAYLQDDNLFMNDLLRLAQTKLKQTQQQQPEKTEVTVTALDALVEAFDAVGDWEMPALSPHPCAGALPM